MAKSYNKSYSKFPQSSGGGRRQVLVQELVSGMMEYWVRTTNHLQTSQSHQQLRSFGNSPAIIGGRTGTWVEPPTYRKPAGKLPHMKCFDTPSGIRTYSGEGQWFEVNNRNHSATCNMKRE